MKLSIITINRNNALGLKKTIESVVSQTFKDFEYIVIDGASTDESVDIIKSYSDKISYWVSEPDTGIYNAMNKGVLASHGEYTLMLNSGDYLVDTDVVGKVMLLLDGSDIVQGDLILTVDGNYFLHKGYAHSELSFIEAYNSDLPHQSMFIKKSLHELYGYYDESYKFVSDTLFFIKVLGLGNASYKYIDMPIAYFEPGGVSVQYVKNRENERKDMYKENLSCRLNNLCKNDIYKIVVYEKLHYNPIIWKITVFLIKLSELLGAKKNYFNAIKNVIYK